MLGILGFFTFLCVNEPVWTEDLPKMGTPEFVVQHGKEELSVIQKNNPELYDLSVVQWALENNMVIRPKNQNNRKWEQMRTALSAYDTNQRDISATSKMGSPDQPNGTAASILEFLSSEDTVDTRYSDRTPPHGRLPNRP